MHRKRERKKIPLNNRELANEEAQNVIIIIQQNEKEKKKKTD